MKITSKNNLLKNAFTMLELVFVIIVIGVLAAIVVPSSSRSPLTEATTQLASHIRYVQHLAMIDDKYNAKDEKWALGRWQIVFNKGANANNKQAYTVYSDSSTYTGDPNKNEIAINPENNNQIMSGGHSGSNSLNIKHEDFMGMKKLNLGMSYGVTDVSLSNGCSGSHIMFDSMGRVIDGKHTSTTNTHQLISSDCNVTLTSGSEKSVITIKPETGFITIKYL